MNFPEQTIIISKLSHLVNREFNAMFINFVDHMNDGILLVDNDEIIVYTNASFCEITGYRKRDLIGRVASDLLLQEQDVPKMKSKIEARNEAKKEGYEIKITTKTGKTKWMKISASPVIDEKGNILGSLGVHSDITVQKEREFELAQSVEEKKILLQEIHHRVKNNLQIVSSLLSLQAKISKSPETAEILLSNQDRINSMAMVHELLYRSDKFKNIHFRKYIENLLTSISNSILDKTRMNIVSEISDIKINIDTVVPCGLIVNELISNAIKHAFIGRDKGTISIKAHHDENQLTLVIEDNGIGLPADYQEKSQNSLGLQLVEILTDQLDGIVNIDLSNGTSFTISFPYKTD